MTLISYLQSSLVKPLRQNQTLLMLCITTAATMMGYGVMLPVLPLYAKSFGVSIAVLGLVVAAFGVARILGSMSSGYLADRLGRRLLLVGGPLVIAAGSFLSGLSADFWQLLVFQFVAGVGSGVYQTGAAIVLADISSDADRAKVMSFNQGSLYVGVTLGPVMGGPLAEIFGLRSPFFLVASLGVLTALWAFTRIPETGHTRVASPSMAKSAPATTLGPVPLPPTSGIRALLMQKDFLLVALLSFAIVLTRMGSRQTLVPLLGDERLGLEPGAIGAVFTLTGAMNLVALAPAGILADRLGRKAVIVPSSFLMALSLLLFALSGSLAFFVLAAALVGIASGTSAAPTVYAADIVPPHLRGAGLGLFRGFGDVGIVIGPVFLGWLADSLSLGWGLGFNAVLMVVVGLAFAAFARETMPSRRSVTAEPARAEGEGR
ncbi:MAG: MFS transporter [Dehalococcoidia bacterium]